MIKYWARLTKLDNCLAVEALKTSKDTHAQNQTSWFRNITEIFDYSKRENNKVLNIKTRGSQEPVIAYLVFNLTSRVDSNGGVTHNFESGPPKDHFNSNF